MSWAGGTGGHVVVRVSKHSGGLGEGAFEAGRDLAGLALDLLGVRLGDDCVDERGEHLGLPARDVREDARPQMDAAALPRRPLNRLSDRRLQTPVGIRDHELHTRKAAVLQAREKRRLEHDILAVAHVDTEDLMGPLRGHTRSDHDRSRDDLMVHACLHGSGVPEHVRERRIA